MAALLHTHFVPRDHPAPGPKPRPERLEVGVVDGRQVERHQLREDEAPDHREAEGATRLGACPEAERDRQRAEERPSWLQLLAARSPQYDAPQ